ncbi:MAG: ABC transporter permease [Candidatus Aminicenantes bacterium]|nr:ABC transporter permease [Candidatus Aminicenantes bacterium]
MGFTIKLAWRNVLRNKRRTVIAGIAIGIGLAFLIFYDGLIIGMEDVAIRSATASFMGEAQIHRRGFRQTQDGALTVRGSAAVMERLRADPLVAAHCPRTLSLGMITSPANVNSILLVGVDPERERRISRIDDAIAQGGFFRGDNPRDMVVGSELAEILEVGLGDRLVATVATAGNGDLAQEMFRVSGIYHFSIKEMDQGMAFVRLPVAQRMLGIGERVHEIAIRFTQLKLASQRDLPFWEAYSANGNEAVSWADLLPQLKTIFDMTGTGRAVMAFLLIIVVIFGIINTLFMSLYERLFEFGVLRAVGTRPWGVFKLMLAESGSLGIISAAIGVLLSLILIAILSKTGIDYRGIEFAGTTFQDLLYPVVKAYQFIVYPAGLFVFTLLVGVYPAAVAARMSITDAIRRSL